MIGRSRSFGGIEASTIAQQMQRRMEPPPPPPPLLVMQRGNSPMMFSPTGVALPSPLPSSGRISNSNISALLSLSPAMRQELDDIQNKLSIEKRLLDAAQAMHRYLKDDKARECEYKIAESQRRIELMQEHRDIILSTATSSMSPRPPSSNLSRTSTQSTSIIDPYTEHSDSYRGRPRNGSLVESTFLNTESLSNSLQTVHTHPSHNTSPGPSSSSSLQSKLDYEGPSKPTSISSTNLPKDAFIKVIVHYESQVLQIAISSRGASYNELCARIERKMKLCGFDVSPNIFRVVKIRCKLDGREVLSDDNESWILLNSDADVMQVFVSILSSKDRVLNVYLNK